jgi:AraC-like DNA-binding protein
MQLVEPSTLATQVREYVCDHLREPGLSPRQVAAANGLSIRSLYALYESMGISLEQSIIRQRLDGARADLVASPQRYASIAATARAWGFTNSSFFSRRFRQTFGVTPRQWRAEHQPLVITNRARVVGLTLDLQNPS